MALFHRRNRTRLLTFATVLLAMGNQGGRREPRGVQNLAPVLTRHCSEHEIDVVDRHGEFLCGGTGGIAHYLCAGCGSNLGGRPGNACSTINCVRNS